MLITYFSLYSLYIIYILYIYFSSLAIYNISILIAFVKKKIKLDKSFFLYYIECMKKYKKQDARTHCANWDNGRCLGCDMYSVDRKLIMRIDSKRQGKECTIDTECNYFTRVVVPAITL